MSPADQGRFVRHDLRPTDPERAEAFYGSLLGWEFRPRAMKGADYTVIRAGGSELGGLVPLGEGEGLSPHWIPYLAVDCCDEAARRVQVCGGQVRIPPTGIASIGRFAIVQDPFGAVFCTLSSDGVSNGGRRGGEGPGRICWNECWTSGPAEAARFYREFLGWKSRRTRIGNLEYWVQSSGEEEIAGIMSLPEDGDRPCWIPYFHVRRLEEDLDRIPESDGEARILLGPCKIPGGGRYAIFRDPCGAPAGLFSP